jgi:hypothetical protein
MGLHIAWQSYLNWVTLIMYILPHSSLLHVWTSTPNFCNIKFAILHDKLLYYKGIAMQLSGQPQTRTRIHFSKSYYSITEMKEMQCWWISLSMQTKHGHNISCHRTKWKSCSGHLNMIHSHKNWKLNHMLPFWSCGLNFHQDKRTMTSASHHELFHDTVKPTT